MIARYVTLVCEQESVTPVWRESEARRYAHDDGWQVGRSKKEPDFCPRHRPGGGSPETRDAAGPRTPGVAAS